MTTGILVVFALITVGVSTTTGALGAYLVASGLARVLLALTIAPLGYPTLVVTALVDGALIWSFLQAAAADLPERPLEHAADRLGVREQTEHAAGMDECDGCAEPLGVLL
ncbi:MAG: hypothetical protein HOV81_07820 [Kofleriaceae bacterium]|nr:hypothetical protein [Kofleriaceae bacterium]